MTSIQDDRELDSNSSLSTYVTKIKALQDWVNGIISKYGFIGDEYKVSTAFLKQYDNYITSEVLSGEKCTLPYAVSGTMIKSGDAIYFQIPANSDTYYRLINWYDASDAVSRFSPYTVADGIRNYLCFIIQCKDEKGGCFHGKIDLSESPESIIDDKENPIKWSFKVSDNNFNLSKSGPISEYFKDNPDITELKFNDNLLLTIAPSIKDFKGLVTVDLTKVTSNVELPCYTTFCLQGDDENGWYDSEGNKYSSRREAIDPAETTTTSITTSINLNISPITSSTITDLVFPPFFYKQNKGFDSDYTIIHKSLERIYINWYEVEKNSSGISSEWVSNGAECTTDEGYPLLGYYTYKKCPTGGGHVDVGITVALPSCISDFSNWVDKLLTYNGSPKDKEDKAPEEGMESSEDFYVLRLDPVESDDGKELIIDCGDGIDEDKKEVIGKVNDNCTAQIYTDDQSVSGETYPYDASSSPADQTNS